MADLALVLGDTLFEGLPGLPQEIDLFLREDRMLATRVRHHRQKITLIFSAMRHFADAYSGKVWYRRYEEEDGFEDILAALAYRVRESGYERVWAYEPHDRFFAAALAEWAEREGIELRLAPSPMFLTREEDWQRYRMGSRRMLMGDFYIQQRRRLGVLVDEAGQPLGGKWSFDEMNREALPMSVKPPRVSEIEPDAITRAVIDLVDREFPGHYGRASEFRYAVDHAGASALLDEFLLERLDRFGPYEDAIPQRERTLFHGVLTPYLNTGLLTPDEIIERTEIARRARGLPLNSVEGFLRQIIGWRDFIFWTDREYGDRGWGPAYPSFFGHDRKLKECWWTGETGLPPIDTAIRRALAHGWTNHIERLMVVGAPMLMCGVHPDKAYRWFMEMYIDSTDWVMAPNVYGMSQFADGGLFATKPYISGSAYIRKMGDYPKGAWCDVWDGLYWGFILEHREFFRKNPRMSAMVASADRLNPARRDMILAAAAEFIDRVTEPALGDAGAGIGIGIEGRPERLEVDGRVGAEQRGR